MSKKNNLIMAIDDSKTMLNIIAFAIDDMGYKTVKACDGREALDFLLKEEVRMIVTDFHMPAMDGLELIRKIRSSGANTTTPILVLSTNNEKDKIQEAKDLGASGWIIKPFSREKLQNVIKEVCD